MSCIEWRAKVTFLKTLLTINGSTDLNENRISCVKLNQVFVQKHLFASVHLLHTVILFILNLYNWAFYM
jgi:hypothetical protein